VTFFILFPTINPDPFNHGWKMPSKPTTKHRIAILEAAQGVGGLKPPTCDSLLESSGTLG